MYKHLKYQKYVYPSIIYYPSIKLRVCLISSFTFWKEHTVSFQDNFLPHQFFMTFLPYTFIDLSAHVFLTWLTHILYLHKKTKMGSQQTECTEWEKSDRKWPDLSVLAVAKTMCPRHMLLIISTLWQLLKWHS